MILKLINDIVLLKLHIQNLFQQFLFLPSISQVIELDNKENQLVEKIESQLRKRNKLSKVCNPKQPATTKEKRSFSIPHNTKGSPYRARQVIVPHLIATQPRKSSKIKPLKEDIPVLNHPQLVKRKTSTEIYASNNSEPARPRSNSEESILKYENEFIQSDRRRKRSRSETRSRRVATVSRDFDSDQIQSFNSSAGDILNV